MVEQITFQEQFVTWTLAARKAGRYLLFVCKFKFFTTLVKAFNRSECQSSSCSVNNWVRIYIEKVAS